MVFSFFRRVTLQGRFDHIVTKSVGMLSDARHSFDLATLALLTSADSSAVAEDIRTTDQRINQAEQDLRAELVVHVTVQGGADIGQVLGFTLLLKKIERIGDQAINILDLAENGVSLADNPDIETMMAERQALSEMFAEAAELLGDPDTDDAVMSDFADRVDAMGGEFRRKIASFFTSELPGREVVPVAIYYRYILRIVANLLGVVQASVEPVTHTEESRPDDLED